MMNSSFFTNAQNVRISGSAQFHSVVARRDVKQFDRVGDVHNENTNNTTRTMIRDSYNDNSRRIVGRGAYPLAGQSESGDEIVEDSEGEDSITRSSEEEYLDNRQKTRRKRPTQNKRAVRSSEGRVDSRPAALDKEVRSEPDTREALSAEPGSRQDVGGRPAPAHTMSAPAAPTQATSTPPALLPSSPYVPPQLAVPQGQFVGKSASLTQNMTTLAGATLSIPASNQPVLAPVQSTLGHPFEHSLTVPSVPLLSSVGQITLNTRYRYLVTREETYYEIRKKLIDVSQSTPKDKFFILKDQAAMANSILRLVEGSHEKIQRNKELVQLSLESHAVAFIAIMAAEKELPNERKLYNLLKILDNVEELIKMIVYKEGLSKWNLFRRDVNRKLIKRYREELNAWLKDFQNDPDVTIDFALHKASNVMSEALYAERQYAYVLQPLPHEGPSAQLPNSLTQSLVPVLAPK